ncbi:MAG: NAD(P)H-binding protein [Pseudomonadota bacterium]
MSGTLPRVLLAGGTGYIGRVVAAELVERGYEVIAPVRSQSTPLPGCQMVVTDLSDRGRLHRELRSFKCTVVISCIASRTGAPKDAWRVDHDINQNLLALAQLSDADQFVLLSAICVQKPRLAFQYAKLAFEQALMQSDLTYSIVRPTAYFRSLSGQINRVKDGKPFLVFGDGTRTACKPIAERDLAAYLVDCLKKSTLQNRVLPIGGPGPALTARAQGELLFELTGKPPQFRSIPPSLFTAVAAMLRPIGWVVPAVARKAEFARIGHYYATESMLLWDEVSRQYDAEATPSTGTTTLRDHYQKVLTDGIDGHEAAEHQLFQ